MAYKINVSCKAQREVYKAIDFYNDLSELVPAKFINAIQETYLKLSVNPFYQIRKNTIRAISIKGFPYILLFSINEPDKEVRVLSCFHTSKNPSKYPG